MLGVAADLKERVAVDRRVVAQPIAPRPGFDGRAGVAGIDVEKDGGNAFDVVAPRKIIVERPLDRRDDVGAGGKNAARQGECGRGEQKGERTLRLHAFISL